MLTPLEILADCEAIGHAVENGYIAPRAVTNERLRDAIDRCIEVESRIVEIVATVPPANDPDNLKEVEALEWKREMIENQIRRAVRAGKERKAHLRHLVTDEDWKAERARCGMLVDAEGHVRYEVTPKTIAHWFRFWAWALDPRADYLPVQPFVPFGVYEDDPSDFQLQYLIWLHETTFLCRKSGAVEKARDMGATLGWLLWATYNWLFGDNFTALLASANEDLVDSKKDPDTLFEKVRFALKLQPPQLLPEGFNLDRDMPYMNIANPQNGSVLSGQAPTQQGGRQKRRKAVLKDESAAWPYLGIPQAVALSAVSDSCFDISSVRGRYNQFAFTALHPSCNKFVMDWRDHPWKDKRWYDQLEFGYVTQIMTKETIAQEVDRDYNASQPGKVFKDWDEVYTCIEWEELLTFYAKHGLYERFIHVDGTIQIPHDWNWARMQDKGETKDHPRMTLYCARPGEGWPLNDSIFFFIEHIAPTAADLGTVVTELTEEQRRFNINPPREPEISINSHEAAKERDIYMDEFGWHWDHWDPDYDSGIGNIRLWLKPIDTHRDNPIRPALKGRARIYFVCRKGQATLQWNPKDKKHFVTPAKDKKQYGEGFQRLRAEMPVYHYKPEEAGKAIQDQRPERIFDDAIVCCPKGTLIHTLRGEVEIQDVTSDDLVLTRAGYRPCSGGYQTKPLAAIWEVVTSEGYTLRATAEHPVWIEGQGFSPLGCVRVNDIVLTCQTIRTVKARELSLTAFVTIGIQNPRAMLRGLITKRINRRDERVLARITSTFGDQCTAMFQRVITSITRMKTPSITASTTWNAFLLETTLAGITQGRLRLPSWPTWNAFDRWPLRPARLLSTELNYRLSEKNNGVKEQHGSTNANTAAPLTEPRHSAELDFALQPVGIATPTESSVPLIATARNAPQQYPQPNGPLKDFVTSRVVSVRQTDDIEPVYNLEVEGEPEYFANGVLVHNCVRGVAVLWGPQPKEKSEHQKMMERMAAELQTPYAQQFPPGSVEHDRIIQSQMHWQQEFEAEEVDNERRRGMGAPVRVGRNPLRR